MKFGILSKISNIIFFNEDRKFRNKLIKDSKFYMPWSYRFILYFLKDMAEWNESYYKKLITEYTEANYIVRDMRLIQNLCSILNFEKKLYEIDPKFHTLVEVNLRNYKRFFPFMNNSYLNLLLEKDPYFEVKLYQLKAQNLLGKIISYKLTNWPI